MFDPTTLTGLHTWISLIAIILGIPVTLALMRGERAGAGITAAFLALAFLTSATGFLFPFSGVKPSHVVGAIALVVVLVAAYALYGVGRGRVAPGLCGGCRGEPLFPGVRRRRAGLRQGAGAGGFGAHPVGAAVRHRSGRGTAGLCDTWYSGRAGSARHRAGLTVYLPGTRHHVSGRVP